MLSSVQVRVFATAFSLTSEGAPDSVNVGTLAGCLEGVVDPTGFEDRQSRDTLCLLSRLFVIEWQWEWGLQVASHPDRSRREPSSSLALRHLGLHPLNCSCRQSVSMAIPGGWVLFEQVSPSP